MAEWKLKLQRDILNTGEAFYPSIQERTGEYETFYLGRKLRGEGEDSRLEPWIKGASEPRENQAGAETGICQEQDDRRTETPFSSMLALYGREGNEYTFSRRGMRPMKRQLPWQGHYHTHDYIEILYVIHGSFQQILLGERHKFTEGEIVITDRNLEHADYLSGEEDAAVLFLFMQSGYLDQLLGTYGPKDDLQHFLFHALNRQRKEQSYLHLTPFAITEGKKKLETAAAKTAGEKLSAQKGQIDRVLELIVREDWNPEEGSEEIIRGGLIRLLSILCRNYSMKLHSSDKESREKIFLYELERYIRQRRGQVDGAMLEEAFHYHRNYFNRILQKYRGMTFREYTRKIRLDYAAALLLSTSLPVRETASRAGWDNSSHFYHLFEARFGISPAEYRKKKGGTEGHLEDQP